MASNSVDVLLATYNGERYLEEQINSILEQTHTEISLLIRDDDSRDSTPNILRKYQQRYPDKIRVVFNDGSPNGPIKNFSKLISLSKAPYVMLSDQDDVWLSAKVSRSFNAIRKFENEFGSLTPILIHTDLSVVDEKISKTIHPSFFKYSGLNPRRNSFGNLLVQNVVTGCASIFNRALADICVPIPQGVLMHDWWLALAASSMGTIGLILEPTVLYRQHGLNTLGAREFSWKPSYLIAKAKKLFSADRGPFVLTDYMVQAQAFQEAMGDRLNPKNKKLLKAFLNLEQKNFFLKRFYLLRYGFLMANFSQNIGLFLRI